MHFRLAKCCGRRDDRWLRSGRVCKMFTKDLLVVHARSTLFILHVKGIWCTTGSRWASCFHVLRRQRDRAEVLFTSSVVLVVSRQMLRTRLVNFTVQGAVKFGINLQSMDITHGALNAIAINFGDVMSSTFELL